MSCEAKKGIKGKKKWWIRLKKSWNAKKNALMGFDFQLFL
jgi:hypothetical protein